MIVKVAIDLALDRLFDYEVPEALREKLAVGQLLSVPFGHREARGFAMAIENSSPMGKTGFTLKPVTAIVDETPFFSAKLLELVKRVAAYTAAPLELVLKTALPAVVLRKSARAKELLFVEPMSADAGPEGIMSLSTLSSLASDQAGQERREGLEFAKTTARQRWLYAQIVRLGGGWLAQLCDELKTTPACLRRLEQLGLVRIAAKARRRNPLGAKRILPSKPLALNEEQRSALEKIVDCSGFSPLLLFGVTGSGKTEVYLQAIAKELEAGRGAIVMVPEISLTPQTVQRFASRFGDRVAVLHSALSDGERYDEWHRIRSGVARVVVGPRSAVWAPVRNLGLIVVDEEHETSYKQDETPRYHARDVAVLRGSIEGAKVVLGSATPSLESWHNVAVGKYRLATMRKRAGAGTLPNIRLVDMREFTDAGGRPIFSGDLIEAIRLRLDRHEQTILFLNRRGYSRQLSCDGCGWVATCGACDIPYTYHRADDCCRCHICGGWIESPKKCPKCGGTSLSYVGIGTQRVEAALRTCFPHARVLRMDADSTSRKNSHDDILGEFGRGGADILIGTQMIAKGLDFKNVTLVGVLNADSSLNMPDFRAAERTFQLLAQVAGRAGRAELSGEVYIQTGDLDSSVLGAVIAADYEKFAADELKARRALYFPPYCHLAVVAFRSQDLSEVSDWAVMYSKSLAAYAKAAAKRPGAGRLEVSEAMPAVLEKCDGWYRWQLTLRADSAALVVRAWRWIAGERPWSKSLRVTIDIDAFNLV